jgi:hypothetical protein
LKLTQKEVEFLTLTAIRNKVEERNERFLLAGAKKSDLPEYKCKMKELNKKSVEERDNEILANFKFIEECLAQTKK